MSNRRNGVLYVGVTRDLVRRWMAGTSPAMTIWGTALVFAG
jgi:predicted GIY-YIG superfamily endonuclease